jgi:hypothetical protein
MPSVKLRPDTLAVLAALRGRFGAGHSYDRLITELIKRHIDSTANAAQAGERLRRVEELTTQNHLLLEQILTLLHSGRSGTSSPPTFKIE